MEAVEYVLQQDEGRERVLLYAKQLSEAFALSVIKQLVSKAVSSDEIINLSYPQISVLPQVE
jgi:hypothetical protein